MFEMVFCLAHGNGEHSIFVNNKRYVNKVRGWLTSSTESVTIDGFDMVWEKDKNGFSNQVLVPVTIVVSSANIILLKIVDRTGSAVEAKSE